MARRLSLVLFVGVATASASGAAPTVPAAAVSTAVRATHVPVIDLTHLFDRLTVPLGTVPVRD